jgi:bacillithiol synthase
MQVVSMGRPFSASFLAGDPVARGFLPSDFRDQQARMRHTRRASGRSLAAPLLEVVQEQNAGFEPSPARLANLEALGRRGTVTVITGQQVGLFLGPLYTYYKAASAVAVARALERESGVRCVPLFWLQTEDHDFEEIASTPVLATGQHAGAAEPVQVSIASLPGQSPRSSIAHRRLGPDVDIALSVVAEALGPAPAAQEVLALLRSHYRPGVPLGRAFAGVLAALFAEDGLLLFDPRVRAVARLATPLYRRAIDDHEAIARCLQERAASLREAGLAEQVPTRPDCPLVFFHEGEAQGPRYRLERKSPAAGESSGAWALAGTGRRVTDEDLEAALAGDPLRFSTSALLRPLVQDTLFPNAAYVGGPAELGYFAQLPPLYDLLGVPQPLVVLRARFRCLDGKARQLLHKMNLRAAEIEQPLPVLLRRLAETVTEEGVTTPSVMAAEVTAAIEPALHRLESAVTAVDPTLAEPARRTRAYVCRAIERMCDKYAGALARRDQVNLRRLERLQTLLYPAGMPQERFYGWTSLAARLGISRFARAVAAGLAPFSTEIGELDP